MRLFVLSALAMLSIGTAAPQLAAQELGDGTYLCQGGLTTAIKAIDKKWSPLGAETKSFTVTIENDSRTAQINGFDFTCQTKFFEFLGCSTGFYHFAMNINTGRFTYDESYGFIRGETPRGDAETVTKTLGFCTPDKQS